MDSQSSSTAAQRAEASSTSHTEPTSNENGKVSAPGGYTRGGREGNRGGRGRAASGRGRHGRNEAKAQKGRAEWSRESGNRRERNEESKRRRIENGADGKPVYAVEFSKEEIEGEERLPKRKVAVLIGYSGSGYKGLQLSDTEKTIEGELFQAFVAAGAVSKANADDPKKASLVRCARTDKGVHAAGNVLSLKLIIEDPDIVKKINDALSPQIRVWDIERTNGSFSAYQRCDSRIYEYLIPTHCFLPPHFKTHMGKKLAELADEAGDREGYNSRQKEVEAFWPDVEEKTIKPLLDEMDPEIATEAVDVLFGRGQAKFKEFVVLQVQEHTQKEALSANGKGPGTDTSMIEQPDTSSAPILGSNPSDSADQSTAALGAPSSTISLRELTPIELAVRSLKSAYQEVKRSYRIDPVRLSRVRSVLSRYVGTHNYHNYTTGKAFHDPSSKRIMKSFVVGENPIIIGNTEWLSLKVHGQSFMMHQIRKMVCMAAMVVRCGTHEGRIQDSFGAEQFVIPRAPGLGLLLERPVFDTYNQSLKGTSGDNKREALDFGKYEAEMEAFKQREIYERIFREEERDATFHGLTASMDGLRSSHLMYLSSKGHEATKLKEGGDEKEVEEALGLEGEGEEPADS